MSDVKIGVYVCHCGINIAGAVDVEEVTKFAQSLSGVVIARNYTYMCSDPGQEIIKKDINESRLNRVVVAACSPGMHEPTFRGVVFDVGLNPYLFEMANIREQCSWVHDDRRLATEKAKRLISSAVAKAKFLESLSEKEVVVTKSALVIGGGIAGIQSALDIAEAGFKVYLVEKDPSIGGRMAQLDKTFPTLDCSACILTPKMVDVSRHPNVELLTYTEIAEIQGYIGNFKVKINKKTRYVDEVKCNACGDCAVACPVEVASEFDVGLAKRKAIYRSFPQAVPNIFTIDKRGISPCRIACPAGVNAQAYIALISQGRFIEALELERQTNPFPSVCGRVCNHPCEKDCTRGKLDEPIAIASLKRFLSDYEILKERKLPSPTEKIYGDKRVAVIGGGPAGLSTAYFLAQKGYPVTIFESLPVLGGMLITGIPEFRLPRSAINNDIEYILATGIEVKTNITIGKDLTIGDLSTQGFKAVFIAVGAHQSLKLNIPGEELEGVFSCLEFLKETNLGKKPKVGKRVAVIGGGNAAVDAARVALRLGAGEVSIVYRRSRKEMPANEWEIEEAEKEGVKVIFLAAPIKFFGKDKKIEGMECLRMQLGPPDVSGRRRPIPLDGSEFIVPVDTVITAVSQAPDLSLLLKDTEIETTKWPTVVVNPETLATSVPGVFAGGDAVSGSATVIEAVAEGQIAANSIDAYLSHQELPKKGETRKSALLSDEEILKFPKRPRVKMPKISLEERYHNFREVETGFSEEQAIVEAKRCLNCSVCCECMQCIKVCKPEAINHNLENQLVEIDVGTIVVAVGFNSFDARLKPEYAYGIYPEVITGLEFERLSSASGPTQGRITINGKEPKKIVFVQCIGSRDKSLGNEYCSRVCCMYTAKQAHLIKEKIEGAEVTVFYIDVRAFGKGFEEFYDRVRNEGVIYRRGNVSEIYRKKNKIIVRAEDTLLAQPIEVEADLVVLATGLVPKTESKQLAQLLKLSRSPDGFLLEAHPKLRPVDTMVDGIYLAGCCQGPKDIPETVAQAKGAASSAMIPLSQGKVKIEPIVSVIDEEFCSGCRICESLCVYQALSFESEKKIMQVNEILCKGCGACGAACPTGAIDIAHFKDRQILAQISAICG
ncbi:MAG: NAD(P)-binding protein [Candidatus Edwardsbacteria bacterium]